MLATVLYWFKVLRTWSFRGSKSRNKVSVGEPAEGSLPIPTRTEDARPTYNVRWKETVPSGRATQRRRSMLVTVVETRILVDASGYLSHVGRFACGEQASGFGPRSAKVQRTVRAKARSVAPSHSRFIVGYRCRTVAFTQSGQRELHRQL